MIKIVCHSFFFLNNQFEITDAEGGTLCVLIAVYMQYFNGYSLVNKLFNVKRTKKNK